MSYQQLFTLIYVQFIKYKEANARWKYIYWSKTTKYLSEDISKNQNSKLCSIESKVQLNFFVLFRFFFSSNTKDSLSLLGRHFPNPNLKIANYPLIPTARVRPMISITPKKAAEGTCIFESTFKQSITKFF